MVTKLGVGPSDSQKEILDARGYHDRFLFLKQNNDGQLDVVENNVGYYSQFSYHRQCPFNTHFTFLVGTIIFMDKSVTHVDVVYFMDKR